MIKKLISWIRSLFAKKEEEQVFSGWIKDDVDSRDQIYGESK